MTEVAETLSSVTKTKMLCDVDAKALLTTISAQRQSLYKRMTCLRDNVTNGVYREFGDKSRIECGVIWCQSF